MFEDKVLIVKLPAVDGLAAGAVVIGEIASLAHKLRDDAMKAAAFEAEALLVCAQAAEILYKNMIKKKKNRYYYLPTDFLVIRKGDDTITHLFNTRIYFSVFTNSLYKQT